ncbi:MAG: adenylate/guanylate cyclase domain-containing protein [Spirochaetales bacterium]|nr:adenylate/guanylate cyclase domain-containing protein [Spirochaetales bacterium]
MAVTISPPLRRFLQGLAVGLGGAALSLLMSASGALDLFEYKTWDLRQQVSARPSEASGRIVLILIDQDSLDWGKEQMGWSYPWPRETQAVITDFCKRAGAKSLSFDVIYSEPSFYGVSDDEAFRRSLTENGRVIGTLALGTENATAKQWPAVLSDPGLSIAGLDEWRSAVRPTMLDFPLATFPASDLAPGFNRLANTNLHQDSDGVYRRVSLFNTFSGHVVPLHALAAYLAGNPGAHSLSIKPGELTVDGTVVPIDDEGRAILRFRGPDGTYKAYGADAIIESELRIREGEKPIVDPPTLKDKHVFFGHSAMGLFDLKPSPTDGQYPGVELHVTQLDNLLSGDFMRPFPLWAQALLLALVCCAAAIIVSAVSKAWRSAIAYLGFLPLVPALGFAAFPLGFWLPIVPGMVGIAVSLVGASLVSFATEGRQKRYLKSAFRQYLSPVVIEQLIAHPESLKLGGEKRELSIYFSDLQGFTSLSEMLTPEELTGVLNDYLSAMTDIIQDEGGTIDKYEGDAIIAFWNAPIEFADHAVRAVRAALRCQAELTRLRPIFRERVKKDLFMRIGVNSGPAVVGNMGSRTRFDYTMLGDAVNLASRLEGTNKQFGTYTMISGATLALTAGAFPARELSRVAVMGRAEPVTVHEPMLHDEYASRKDALAAFDRGLRAYYAGKFGESSKIFESIAGQDPAAKAYLARCRELADHPPAGAWTGVWVMTTK